MLPACLSKKEIGVAGGGSFCGVKSADNSSLRHSKYQEPIKIKTMMLTGPGFIV